MEAAFRPRDSSEMMAGGGDDDDDGENKVKPFSKFGRGSTWVRWNKNPTIDRKRGNSQKKRSARKGGLAKAVRVGLGQDKGGKGKGRGREKKIKGTKVTRGGTSRCRVHKSHDLFFSFFCMLIQAVLRGQECHPVGSRPLEAPHKLSLAQAKHSGQGVLARYSPQVQVDFGLWPFTDSVSGLQ